MPHRSMANSRVPLLRTMGAKSDVRIGVFAAPNGWRAIVYAEPPDQARLQRAVVQISEGLQAIYELQP